MRFCVILLLCEDMKIKTKNKNSSLFNVHIPSFGLTSDGLESFYQIFTTPLEHWVLDLIDHITTVFIDLQKRLNRFWLKTQKTVALITYIPVILIIAVSLVFCWVNVQFIVTTAYQGFSISLQNELNRVVNHLTEVRFIQAYEEAMRLRELTPREVPSRVMLVRATAYSSTPDQTDDSPFITANGLQVYDGLIAANFLRHGTRIKIPELYGEKIFTVNDRMNPRYSHGAIDIWMKNRELAEQFGAQFVTIEVYDKKK